jgi:large subunit ribosomal protein L5
MAKAKQAAGSKGTKAGGKGGKPAAKPTAGKAAPVSKARGEGSGSQTYSTAPAEVTAEEAAFLQSYIPSLKTKYHQDIVPAMMKRFQYKNVNEVPKLVKITVNMGVGEASRDAKLIDTAVTELAVITGQKPSVAKARKSIAAFKLREGMAVGAFVTLRGLRMFEFLERLVNVAIPRIRDFRGLPTKSFDGRGNHSMGVREHLIFTELDYNKVTAVKGLNVCTVTTAKTDEEALELLRLFGFPFREK